MDWLKDNIEDFLLRMSSKSILDRILLAEMYSLNRLRNKLIEKCEDVAALECDRRFTELSNNAKYKLQRQQIISKIGKREFGLIAYLDNLFE